MELYRALGIEHAVRSAGEPSSGFAVAEALSGDLSTWIAPPKDDVEAGGLSPSTPYSCDQERLEPILLQTAKERGVDVRFSTTAQELFEREDGVELSINTADGGGVIRAQFVVVADGSRSELRESLGIAMSGSDVPGQSVSAVFRADLEPALRGRSADAVFCRAAAAFLFARGNRSQRRWQVGTYVRPDWIGLSSSDLESALTDVLREATGIPQLQPLIEDIALWQTGAFVADRFRAGRTFFVGDAAHIMPPYGGLGGNTGVHDAHDLAWMLAAVIHGRAPERLLDRYEAERRPIDRLTVDQALLRSRKTPGHGPVDGEVDALSISLGTRYGSEATAGFDDPSEPTMDPGTRPPHIALRDERNLFDFIDPCKFTAIVRDDCALADARVNVVPISYDDISSEHSDRWANTYGRAFGYVIRPDGMIAGRIADAEDIARIIDQTLMLSERTGS